ncbi:hypothetical protein AKJ65_01980 [candidate division MSBL1 archaeon SCGC-AAA259E19]|uniref:Glycosyltransferase RgtA/B/C/D-like domain-containing protein n=1 Tax=candidate division MSBL1 archaeon SCGC-AAA259E19 TaxID=1698264 RepID=A0A133UMA5_9EURY|nr:hypothetical protein AKJ65_01980 [candidate division MSBL1 archaeon SCGC-AAA259E19]
MSLLRIFNNKISNLEKGVLLLQVLFFGSIVLNFFNLRIPILREITGFLLLSFAPGILILKFFLKKKNLNFASFFFCSIGLSIAVVTIIGLILNFLYPLLGISEPLSSTSLIITINFFLLLLFFTKQIIGEDSPEIKKISFIGEKERIGLLPILSILFLPILAIFGTHLMNIHDNSMLIQLLLIFSSTVPLIYSLRFSKVGEKKKMIYFSIAIFAVSLSLLFHMSLISHYIWGSDQHLDFFNSRLILESKIWNPSSPTTKRHSMLSITILPTMISKITNVELTWVYKTMFPFFFSFIPVGLFIVFTKFISDKRICFFSALTFAFLNPFYTNLLNSPRTGMALFFFSVLFVFTQKSMKSSKKALLSSMLTFLVITSHYGFSYFLFFGFLLGGFLLSNLIQLIFGSKRKIGNLKLLKGRYVVTFGLILFSWYIYTSQSVPLTSGLTSLRELFHGIFNLFGPRATGIAYLQVKHPTLLHNIAKYITGLLLIFATIYLLKQIVNIFLKGKKIKKETKIMPISFICLLVVFIAFAAPAMPEGIARPFLFSSLFLAPFYVKGGIYLIKSLFSIVKKEVSNKITMTGFSIFLCILLVFYSGLIFPLNNEESTIALDDDTVGPERYNKMDHCAAQWIEANKTGTEDLYSSPGNWVLDEYYLQSRTIFDKNQTRFVNDSFIYLSHINLLRNIYKEKIGARPTITVVHNFDEIPAYKEIQKFNHIYDSLGSQVYYYNN